MLLIYPYATCWLDIVSTLTDTVFGHVVNMSATCRADTHVSVNSTIFLTFENPTFPAKEYITLFGSGINFYVGPGE